MVSYKGFMYNLMIDKMCNFSSITLIGFNDRRCVKDST